MSYKLISQTQEAPWAFVYQADCIELMKAMTTKVACAFFDPPFNIKRNYDVHNDDMTEAEYAEFTLNWFDAAIDVLLPGGSLIVHVPDSVAILILRIYDRLMETRPIKLQNWILWHYRFGQHTLKSYIPSRCHCFRFVQTDGLPTWNPEAVLVQSDRASKYNDKRTENTEHPGMRPPFDIWGLPEDGQYWGRVTGNSKERRPLHDNQLPEVYLERILRGWTNPDDWILEGFAGSGTATVVARALGRHAIACDISEAYANSVVERIGIGSVRI